MIGQPIVHTGICIMIIHAINIKIYFSLSKCGGDRYLHASGSTACANHPRIPRPRGGARGKGPYHGVKKGPNLRGNCLKSSGGFSHVQKVRPNRGPTKGAANFLHGRNNGRHPRVNESDEQKKVASFFRRKISEGPPYFF